MREIYDALVQAEALLRPGGVLIVVSFHSLEDRLVKSFMNACAGKRSDLLWSQGEEAVDAVSMKMLREFSSTPSKDEVHNNPRSR
jgi:16S rRNA (cytosine1402-N4)-methyltransferase